MDICVTLAKVRPSAASGAANRGIAAAMMVAMPAPVLTRSSIESPPAALGPFQSTSMLYPTWIRAPPCEPACTLFMVMSLARQARLRSQAWQARARQAQARQTLA